MSRIDHCTKMRFASFLSGGFTTVAVINPPERKLAEHTSVHWSTLGPFSLVIFDVRDAKMAPNNAVVYPEQCLVGFVFSELPLDLAGKLQISLLAYPNYVG